VSRSYHGAMARTETASRVIAAPLDRVFAALVNPEALTAWLPPDGMSGRFERFDAARYLRWWRVADPNASIPSLGPCNVSSAVRRRS